MRNRLSIVVLLFALCSLCSVEAQKTAFPFFDQSGKIRLQTTELDALADTIAVISHRADDIVWARVVYRVIDMREKQNYRLYFPTRYDNPTYRNLFKVMLDAICEDGLTAYERGVEGETLACGTGATAVFEICHHFGFLTDNAIVKLKGGVLMCSHNSKGEILVTGDAKFNYKGETDILNGE